MEAIGTLAGGLAHDFNNILMGIMGYTSIMLSETGLQESQYAKLQSIEQYVRSGANLTRQLLGFARGGKYDVQPVDMNSVIKKSAVMFGRTKKEIRLEFGLSEGLWTVEADEGQIEQVFMNLYMNAWQAMPCGGTLCIATENRRIDEKQAKQPDIEPGPYVAITVRDTGMGMDEDVQQRIFEPFFTTKESERGTGLGLASAYGILQNHGGAITVDSKKGEGTTFTLYIPASEKEVEGHEERSSAIVRGTERVLIIDDEETMIDVGAELLDALGYSPMTAGSGEAGLEFFQNNASAIDLVIVDLIMPGMNGGELCKQLKQIQPSIKIVLSSGYSLNDETSELLGRYCDGFIQKPFSMKELSCKLREVLENMPCHTL